MGSFPSISMHAATDALVVPVLSCGLRQSGEGGICEHLASCDCLSEQLHDKGSCLQVAPNTVTASDQSGQLAQSVAQVII